MLDRCWLQGPYEIQEALSCPVAYLPLLDGGRCTGILPRRAVEKSLSKASALDVARLVRSGEVSREVSCAEQAGIHILEDTPAAALHLG